MAELIDRRILGAVRAVDAITGMAIRAPLELRGPGLSFQRTRSGAYAIVGAAGLETHIHAFNAPPAAPVAQTIPFTFEIQDPAGKYLAAAAAIRLPRRWDPANDIRDPMVPIDVALASSAARDLAPGWAGVMVQVSDQNAAPLRGAIVEVFAAGGTANRFGWSLANERGLAIVAVPGLPDLREVENDPAVVFDDEIVTAETAADVRLRAHVDRRWPVDPVILAAGGAGIRTTNLANVQLTPGRTNSLRLTVDLS